MDEKRVEGYRHFINKIWNAARFALMYVKESDEGEINRDKLDLPDRWILSHLSHVTQTVSDALDDYRFNEAAGALYQFVWHTFCDWYLEIIKPTLYGENGDEAQQITRRVLERVLADVVVLLHPFAPYVSEEIWDKLPGRGGSLQTASWPDLATMQKDSDAEADMDLMIDLVTGIRNIRGEMNIAPSIKLSVTAKTDNPATNAAIEQVSVLTIQLAGLSQLAVDADAKAPTTAATAVVGDATLYVDLAGVVDFEQEIDRLTKNIAKLEKEKVGLEKKLNNRNYVVKAPVEVVATTKQRHVDCEEKLTTLAENRKRLEAMRAGE